ncbi:hypothetical protein LAZ40_12790 [Cereibacter sphaeroides]|uniref:hypothetical protein n=1 Tax=Rhodobacterales TaxID=204455 RepID=UPI001E299EFD|nr:MULTISPECIES: hypothetical protein [Paracoccaceae]MCE6952633.1 hypothetical protein [Cereibacter sphaeroides]MCE6959897.1 hypothetical protein [Cereibacter sphaeroides]MCE6968466.1 hypothetical protein [Cereibacter sphaeroides]MCE6972982.1 hypothetical protein [Cereibacter sphaeroides]
MGGKAVISRLAGAIVRAVLVVVLLATPSILLPGVGSDGKQMVALVALFGGILTLVEYNATYPGLIEFRDAPPFNRIRFLLLFAMVLALTLIARGETQPTSLTMLVSEIGALVGSSMDFPYSPVRLATLMLSDRAGPEIVEAVRNAAATTYLIALATIALFVVVIRLNRWPSRNAAFNVWVNLPTFEATAGGDVVQRLLRDARLNVALGFLLPFLIPTVVKIGSSGLEPLTLASPQTLVWTMAAWAFLPASLFMRGVGMARIAEMIREKRRMGESIGTSGFVPV